MKPHRQISRSENRPKVTRPQPPRRGYCSPKHDCRPRQGTEPAYGSQEIVCHLPNKQQGRLLVKGSHLAEETQAYTHNHKSSSNDIDRRADTRNLGAEGESVTAKFSDRRQPTGNSYNRRMLPAYIPNTQDKVRCASGIGR